MSLSSPGQLPESGAHDSPLTTVVARLSSVDLLRGAVIILMALDHSRDFFGLTLFDPTDPARTTPTLFATRWITHFCAPVFVFLAGVGPALSIAKGKPRGGVARTLVLRGFWLIFLEFSIVRVGWNLGFALDYAYRFAVVQVIWALGWSMIVLAALVFLPRWLVLALSLAITAGHNTLDHVQPESLGPLSDLWRVLHVPGAFEWAAGHMLDVRYPLIPWPGVMALGYLFAGVLALPARDMRRWCVLLGAGMSVAFVALRGANLYGDPNPWAPQDSALRTVFSFLNVSKYPPSLCYLLITLGPAIATLPFLDRLPGIVRRVIEVFGKTPMFFYVTHLFLLQTGGICFAYARYGKEILEWQWVPASYYMGLAPVYLAWLVALTILYFPCRWYARVKHRRTAWWHWML